MSKVIFAKYNKSRKKEFQISTVLYEENGKRYARKAPITMEASGHIANMRASYDKLKDVYVNLSVLEGQYKENCVEFEFVEGETVTDKLLGEAVGVGKEKFLAHVKEISGFLYETKCELAEFEKSDTFVKVFGDVAVSDKSMEVTNIDMIFDNIVERNGKFICLDYEWTFDFPVPVRFVLYRSIHYFYTRNAARIDDGITQQELMSACGIDEQSAEIFRVMEENFQRWVFGEDNYALRYVKRSERNVVQNHANLVRRVLELQEEEEERNRHIAYLDEQLKKNSLECRNLQEKNEALEYEVKQDKKIIYDKDVHIRNIEGMMALKDNHIHNLEQRWNRLMSNPLVKIAKVPFKVVRKIYRGVKKIYHKIKERSRAMVIHKLQVPHCNKPLVSIIIPVYNQFDYTYKCINSIIEHTNDVPYEIIVGDDVSTDATRNISRYIKGITVIRNQQNLRFLLNCNHAAKSAKGKYIFFLNNDTEVTEGWLSSLVELIESDGSIGMVGSKLIYPNGVLQEAGGIIWSDATGWNYGRNDDASKPEYNYVREVDYISGASVMIRKSVWEEIGGFDELFVPAYYEDTDLAFEVRKHGYKVMYQPKSVVVHYEGISNGTDTSGGGQKAYQVVNREKFAEKWKEELKEQFENSDDIFPARERLMGRKTVLFIDHYVPHFDQDAGSKSTMSYINAFLNMGYAVKFIGDNYYQHEPYTSVLQQMGVEVLYGNWYAQNWQTWIKENAEYLNVVFMNRPHISIKYILFLKENTKAKIIYYGHDLHYVREYREYELTKDEETLKSSKHWEMIEYKIMDRADVIFYPSYVEINEIVSKHPEYGKKAYAIPVYVYKELYEKEVPLPKDRKDIMFVGGFGHAPNVDAMCWFTKYVFPMILEAYPDIKLHIIGSKPTEEILALANENIVVHGFVSDEELEEFYRNCRLAVVPLRYGAGMKGKVVEALYYQIPLITTPIGAEGMPEAESVMLIEEDAAALAKCVNDLYDDFDRLQEMSAKTKAYIQKYFSEEAAERILCDSIRIMDQVSV